LTCACDGFELGNETGHEQLGHVGVFLSPLTTAERTWVCIERGALWIMRPRS
jgi:hypothetical protein